VALDPIGEATGVLTLPKAWTHLGVVRRHLIHPHRRRSHVMVGVPSSGPSNGILDGGSPEEDHQRESVEPRLRVQADLVVMASHRSTRSLLSETRNRLDDPDASRLTSHGPPGTGGMRLDHSARSGEGGEPAIVGRRVLLDGVAPALDLDGPAERDDMVGGRFRVRSPGRRPDAISGRPVPASSSTGSS
jgi:hypothetical protein